MLSISDVHAGYGRLRILQGVSLSAAAGQITGIIGPNGAGKSTTLKTIFGYLRPWEGHITFGGQNITGRGPDTLLRLGLAFVAQARALFPHMTVHENLVMGGFILPRSRLKAAIDRVLTQFPLLAERRTQLAGTMSGGQQRLLELARATLLEPKMVLLDEPSAALAPLYIDQTYDAIVALQRQGTGFLIVEQNVEIILDVAQQVYALELGRNAYNGPPEEFRQSELLRRLYLGAGAIAAEEV